jgi:5'-3' exonuclease
LASEDRIDEEQSKGFEKKPKIDNMIVDVSNLMYRIIGSINATDKKDSNDQELIEEIDIAKFNELDSHNKVMEMVRQIFNKIMNIKKYYKCEIHVCWEGSNNFRFEIYPEYKANRDRTTELTIDVSKVKTILKEVLSHTTITQWDGNYCEGDDIMGTLSRTLKGNVAIYSTDRDFFQLLEDSPERRVFVICPRKKLSDLCISYNDHVNYFNFNPEDRVFIKSLEGDVGDNIKGCKGIGRKTAVELHKAYGTITNLYNKVKNVEVKQITETKRSYKERLDLLCLSESRIRNLKENEANVRLALLLGRIKTNVDIFYINDLEIQDTKYFFDKYGWEFYQHKNIFCITEQIEIKSLEEQNNA